MSNYGFLAIWTDIEPENFTEYRRWLSREHMGQRIFAPGFLAGRVHSAADDELSHFILYATEHKQVLQSKAYLDVLNNPTPWTQRMMPRLRSFDRGAGEQIAKAGDGSGAWLLVSRLAASPKLGAGPLEKLLLESLEVEGIVTSRLFEVDRPATDIGTAEKVIRSGVEGAFQLLLIIEATGEAALITFEQSLRGLIQVITGTDTGYDARRYRSVYSLHPFERQR